MDEGFDTPGGISKIKKILRPWVVKMTLGG
jgi:hypothetical protein